MKEKRDFFKIFLFFLLISNMISFANALDYGVGVREDQELVWNCTVCNQIEMDTIFGSDWKDSGIFKNLSVGRRMKWKINSIEVNQSLSRINFDIWDWTSEKIWGPKDNISEMTYFFDSLESNFTQYTSLIPFWFPVPVGEFIGNLELNEWYDVDNRVLPTLNVELEKDTISLGYPQKNIKIIAIYNDLGLLSSYKLYTDGNIVIVDISLNFLPVYVIPILIGLFLGISLGLGLYAYKKRRVSSN